MNGSIESAGACAFDSCVWYSDFVTIPGEATVNAEEFRTFNVKVSSGPKDWSRKNPWRAPGTAPVYGSGCGIYGGKEKNVLGSSGQLLGFHEAGMDGQKLPGKEPMVWPRGSIQEVAWAITANHGGGYSYRLCPKGGEINEECFQKTVLRFAGDTQRLVYGNVTQMGQVITDDLPPYLELPLTVIRNGTHPEGSEWARNPIPSCLMFDQVQCEGLEQDDYISCAQAASGYDVVVCPPNWVQFPEPFPGVSGHVPYWRSSLGRQVPQWINLMGGKQGNPPMSRGFSMSIMDLVKVPKDLPEGEYLLSWRWDCEQSAQVWQSCADILIVNDPNETSSQLDDDVVFP
eukprot:Skav207647  [mRNA]  locus=scaffold2758:23314:24345:+ [translate_table: standard]